MEEAARVSEVVPERKRYPFLVEVVVRLVKEKPVGTVGGVLVLLMFFTGVFADFIAPYGMDEVQMTQRLAPPSPQFILGTDSMGRDLLSRIIYGARVSMIVGIFGSLIAGAVATSIGVTSGFLGGKFDVVIQRFVDAWMCFPPLFLYLTMMRCDPCGSGGRLRRTKNIGITKKAYPWSWGKSGIPYYCTHCCLAWEIIPTELWGYPIRINLVTDRPEDPCVHLFYKKPELIPEEYFDRLGMTKKIRSLPDNHAP